QELGEPADVRVVERGLDLVEEVERARAGEEEREQERDRAERLLATREEREARHLLAGRPQLDLDAGLLPVLLGLCQPQAALAAREERRCDLVEVALDGGERLGEARLDRVRQVVTQPLELGEALLEVSTLRRQLREPLLLGLVLLLRQRVHLAELLATLLVACELLD